MVKCAYCDTRFDRDVKAYVQISTRRYGHADCYLRECEKRKISPTLEIYDQENVAQCCYCKKPMNLKADEYIVVSETNHLYAHPECVELEEKREKTDEEKLQLYICQLYDVDYVPPYVQKQIVSYIKTYKYTYSGILKALKYFYEIKGNKVEPKNYSIGIIPYVYADAYNYYYNLWLANQQNQNKNISDYIPKEVEINITPPKWKNPLKKYFTFLEEDELIDGE